MRKDGLESRIATLACWRGPVTLAPLEGGLTNLSYVADDGREKFVVRCGDDIAVHHVFRDRERWASVAAFEAGLSPEVVHAEPGILVLRFIDGRTFGEPDLAADGALEIKMERAAVQPRRIGILDHAGRRRDRARMADAHRAAHAHATLQLGHDAGDRRDAVLVGVLWRRYAQPRPLDAVGGERQPFDLGAAEVDADPHAFSSAWPAGT